MRIFRITGFLLSHFLKDPFLFFRLLNRRNLKKLIYALKHENEGFVLSNMKTFISESKVRSEYKIDEEKVNESRLEEECQVIRSHFDVDYYRSEYPEVKNSDDPVLHYCTKGWRKGYDPSHSFSTVYYLENNTDVLNAKINPFYHFIMEGQVEGRLGKLPNQRQRKILDKLKSLDQKVADCRLPHLPSKSKVPQIKKAIVELSGSVRIFSFSHDNYNREVGGVQFCIRREQRSFQDIRADYIHISPVQFLPRISYEYDYLIRLMINGKDQFILNWKEFIDLMKSLKSLKTNYLIVHSLYGHNPSNLIEFYKNLKIESSFFWIHDYASICANHNLLRNGLEYCNSPSIDSNSCSICIYSSDRKVSQSEYKKLFSAVPFQVIAPSKLAYDVWKESGVIKRIAKKHVIPHCHFERKMKTKKSDGKRQLKIAFLGYPVDHKGWEVFNNLVRTFGYRSDLEFFLFGRTSTDLSNLKQISVSFDNNNEPAMIDALSQRFIDYAIIWSIWPETFCFTAYEALAAGVSIICNQQSGNIKHIVRTHQCGRVLNSEKELLDLFVKNNIPNLIKERESYDQYGTLQYSRMTAEIIDN